MTESLKRRRNRHSAGRILAWGGSAAIALAAVVVASQSETGATRLETALLGADSAPAPLASPTRPAPAVNVAAIADVKRLTEQVRDLTADRDRLAARLASLERHLSDANDTTGSIGTQPDAAKPAATGPSPAEVASEKPAHIAPTLVVNPDVLPKLAAIAAPVRDTPGVIEPLTMLLPENAFWIEPEKAASEPQKAEAAAPIKVNVPLPPVRVAMAPVQRPPSPPRMEYAIDLGGSITTDNIAAQWAAVKANLGPLLTGLRPAIGRDHRFGRVPYRLVVGPLASQASAARLCGRLIEAGIECRPTRFEGEQLAQF